MNIEKKHWITNGAELVKSGDLVRLRGDDGEWGEWGSADHLAGTRVDSFVQWHGMGVQFARVPTAAVAVKPSDGDEWIADPTETIQPGDLYRVREDSHSDYCEWRPADHYAGMHVGYFNAWHSRDIQFCRPVRPATQAAPEPEWEPLPIEDDTILQLGRDEARVRAERGEWSAWVPLSSGPLSLTAFIAEQPSYLEWEFRRRGNWTPPAPEQSPAPTTDRGERYRRTITQSLPGDTIGLSVTVDVADICEAFQLPYMLAQAAKKIMLPGERGSKDRLKDLREAAWHIQRQIQIEEARQQEQADL